MSRNRHYKERQTSRLNWAIEQKLAAEKLRQEQAEYEETLQNQHDCEKPSNEEGNQP